MTQMPEATNLRSFFFPESALYFCFGPGGSRNDELHPILDRHVLAAHPGRPGAPDTVGAGRRHAQLLFRLDGDRLDRGTDLGPGLTYRPARHRDRERPGG